MGSTCAARLNPWRAATATSVAHLATASHGRPQRVDLSE
jgi:hypothetical protein